MPKKSGQVFHVVSADWFKRWQLYVGLQAPPAIQKPGPEVPKEAKAKEEAATEQEQVKATFKNLNKQMIKQMELARTSKSSLGPEAQDQTAMGLTPSPPRRDSRSKPEEDYPGPINNSEQLKKLTITNDNTFSEYLPFLDDSIDNRILQPASEIQEDEHFILLPDRLFSYLYEIYGGNDIRRFSIALASDGESPAEHIVELQLRQLKVFIIPRISYYPTASNVIEMPFTVYTSRQTTVGELHLKIAQSLQNKSTKNNKDSL